MPPTSKTESPIVVETTIQPLHQFILDITGYSHEHFDKAFAEEMQKSLEKVVNMPDVDLKIIKMLNDTYSSKPRNGETVDDDN